jgi:hypothetical protein
LSLVGLFNEPSALGDYFVVGGNGELDESDELDADGLGSGFFQFVEVDALDLGALEKSAVDEREI